MKLDFGARRNFEVGPKISAGGRELHVVSEKLVMKTYDEKIVGVLVSPVYVIFFESGIGSYVYSVLENVWINLEELFSKYPELRNELRLQSS